MSAPSSPPVQHVDRAPAAAAAAASSRARSGRSATVGHEVRAHVGSGDHGPRTVGGRQADQLQALVHRRRAVVETVERVEVELDAQGLHLGSDRPLSRRFRHRGVTGALPECERDPLPYFPADDEPLTVRADRAGDRGGGGGVRGDQPRRQTRRPTTRPTRRRRPSQRQPSSRRRRPPRHSRRPRRHRTRSCSRGGRPEGGVERIVVSKGETVRTGRDLRCQRRDPPARLRHHPHRRARASPRASASRPTRRASSRSRATPRRTPAREPLIAPAGRGARLRPARFSSRTASSGGPTFPSRVAVRLGGGDGAGRLLRGARGPVARSRGCRTAASARSRALSRVLTSRASSCCAARSACALLGARGLERPGRVADGHGQLRAHVRVRDLLARAGAAAVLFGDVFRAFNPWRAIGRAVAWVAQRGGARPAPGPVGLPGAARPLARGGGHLRVRRVGACGVQRRQARKRGRSRALVYSALTFVAHGPLRRRGVVRAGRGVRRLLQPVLAHLAALPPGRRGRPAAAALGPGRARAGRGHRARCWRS